MSKFSRQKNWPKLRADLQEQKLALIQRFIAEGSFDHPTVDAFAKAISDTNRDLDLLDLLETKARAIGPAKAFGDSISGWDVL